MNIAVAVLKVCQVKNFQTQTKDGLDDETLLAGYKCTLHSKLQTQNHNLNHILMTNVRASLEEKNNALEYLSNV